MLKVILIILAVLFAISVIRTYKRFFLAAAILAVAGYVGYRVYKAKKAKVPDATTAEPATEVEPVVTQSAPTAKVEPVVTEPALTAKVEPVITEPALTAKVEPILTEPAPIAKAEPVATESVPAKKVEPAEPTSKAEENAPQRERLATVSTEINESPKSEIQQLLEQKIAQFNSEIAAIPKIDVTISEAVERRRVRDLPEYGFSNFTRKTNLASVFPLVCIDVETTGLHPTKSEIVEVTAIRFERGMIPISCFSTLCKPKKPIPPEATQLNHITNEMVTDSPSFSEIAPALSEYIRGCNLVGHNLDFDLRFLFVHGTNLPTDKRFYDTLDLAHYTVPNSAVYNYKLDTLCNYYGILRGTSHRAESDCYATAKLMVKLVEDKTARNLVLEED